ncbi:MAG TPA: pilin [Lysobacter sp.]
MNRPPQAGQPENTTPYVQGGLSMKRQQQTGFTLIELMIVIAILGILIAIALPAYQDYAVRTKNSECLAVAAAAKMAVAETAHAAIAFASIDTAAAGYAFTASDYCNSITIANGTITATTRNTGATILAVFELVPTSPDASGRIEWDCNQTAGGVPAAQIPKECR